MIPIPIVSFVEGRIYLYSGDKYPCDELICTLADGHLLHFETEAGGKWQLAEHMVDKHDFVPIGWAKDLVQLSTEQLEKK